MSLSVVSHAVEPKKHKVLAVETTAAVSDPSIKRFRLFDTHVHGMHKEKNEEWWNGVYLLRGTI